jgi:hypothetical protein
MTTVADAQHPSAHRLPWPVRSFARGRRRAFRYAVAGLLLIAGAVVADVYPRHPVPVPIASRFPQTTLTMRSPGKLRVLFLGNSLTQYNGGLATVMEQLCASAKLKPMPVFDQLTKFGATWAQLWDVTKARDLIHQGGWDFVVLQDYSTAPLIYPSEMQVYGRRFSNAVRSVGAKPVFFMTWPHQDHLETLQPIAAAYVGEAKDNHGITAPVGWAWKAVEHDHPELILYDMREKPAKHPTAAGTYLTACVFYSMFFNHSPVGLTSRIVEGTNVYINLKPADAKILQKAAWQAVQNAGPLASTQPAALPPTTQAVKHATASR